MERKETLVYATIKKTWKVTLHCDILGFFDDPGHSASAKNAKFAKRRNGCAFVETTPYPCTQLIEEIESFLIPLLLFHTTNTSSSLYCYGEYTPLYLRVTQQPCTHLMT